MSSVPSTAFRLHPQLHEDTIHLGDFPLCQLLLLKNATLPWYILVPMLPGLREIHDLSRAHQHQLVDESSQLAMLMQQLHSPSKLNIAALGNMVPQLHLHHIARYESDPAWPGPVWGNLPAAAYDEAALEQLVERLHAHMPALFSFARPWER